MTANTNVLLSILHFFPQELAKQEFWAFPYNASIIRKNNRCAVTGRARGKLRRWRLSRVVFRELADNSQLSGVTRAWW